jgi:hypothetical protein
LDGKEIIPQLSHPGNGNFKPDLKLFFNTWGIVVCTKEPGVQQEFHTIIVMNSTLKVNQRGNINFLSELLSAAPLDLTLLGGHGIINTNVLALYRREC